MPGRLDLLNQPISYLLRRLAVPVGTGFFFNTMFNVVDVYYGGRISTQALAALSLCFPMFFLIVALGAGLLMATTALIGHALGAGDRETAELYAAQAISFAQLHALLLMVIGLAAVPVVFGRMGASGPYLELAVAYARALFWGAPFFLGNYAFNAMLSASGDTRSFRNFLVGSFFLNLLFDPWFVYGGLGLPPLGLAGIAWATVLIQFCGNCYMLRRVVGTGLLTRRSWQLLLPRLGPFRRLFAQAIPASLNMLTVSLGIFVITWFVGRYGTAAVAAYGICTRIEQIVILPVMGLNVATLTLVAQNFGAGNFARVEETQRTALRAGLWLMTGGSLLVFFLAKYLLILFSRDPQVIAIGQVYLRITALVLGAYVILYINNAALQGLQKPAFALWIGLFRQIAAPLVAFQLLAIRLGFGLTGIWWGVFLVTWGAAVLSLLYTRHTLRIMGRETEIIPAPDLR
jgi:putative MATE family efflux protein